ncbi:S-layer homology domain-containing protein [Sedimentibacter sp.]|uniref:S-layer homology domain-containing protein n=1 Tax=Sedimentibacter sp. TaxID=1960295 RepID=UPI0028A7E8FF|nr:S-layer homology domain-containing protein [Sedimentibacter sp.]
MKRVLFILALMLIICMPDNIFAESISEEIDIGMNENKITVSGKLNEANKDITIIVYRSSDNSRTYIDQGKTDENGEFKFLFSLPNGTFFAVLNAGGKQYTTENIVVYKYPEGNEPESINVDVSEDNVNITGQINEKNKDVSLMVYRVSDNTRFYIDQGLTDANGDFDFSFTLPNGTYIAVISTDKKQYTTEKIVVYKEPDNEEPEDINAVVNENNVRITGKINKTNEDISLIVYKDSDNTRVFLDQGMTDGNGNLSFAFTLPNGTYFAVISTGNRQYISDKFVVSHTKPIISAEISPASETFDKNPANQRDVITNIIWNDAETVIDIKSGNLSIGKDNYKIDNYKLTIKKEYLALQEKGSFVLSIEFDKGLSSTFTVNIVDTTSGGGSSGGGRTKPAPIPVPEQKALPTDIEGHWAKEYVNYLVERGIISSYPDNTFRPDKNITRAEFITLIIKTFGLESSKFNVFNDTRNHWAKDYISAAIENNIILGHGNDMFEPDEMITREQMAVVIAKALNLKIEFSKMHFNDKDKISAWAMNYVSSAVRENIINGYPDNTFKPQDSLTRAEAATIIYNILNK